MSRSPVRARKRTFTRHIPLNEPALNILGRRQRLTSNEAGLVFPPRGEQVTNLNKDFQELFANAGIDRADKGQGAIVWHSLRHSFGTRAANRAKSLHRVKEIMGRSSVKTTEWCLHSTEQDIRELADSLWVYDLSVVIIRP